MFGDEQKDPAHWRKKYYDSLEQLEQQEKQLGEVEAVLRRNISRLSHISDGYNELIDEYLIKLRHVIQTDGDTVDIERIVSDITGVYEKLQKSKASHSSHSSQQQVLADVLEGIQIPQKLSKKVKVLQKHINDFSSGQDAGVLVTELTAFINTMLEKSGGDTGKSSGGLFGLFGGKSDEATTPTVDISSSSKPEVGEVLLQLIERLHLPADMSGDADTIKAILEQGIEEAQVSEVLTMMANLISDIRIRVQKERNELQTFLKQLAERLKQLDVFIQSSESLRKESLRGGRELDVSLKTQVKGIETSIKDALDLDSLKTTIQGQLDTIGRHMTKYVQAEETRNRQAETEMQSLTSKLHDMEHEASTLRKKVQLEHRQALLDPLTNVGNRLAYNERVTQEYARWKRYQTPLTMVVCDLDMFKEVNDNYGHKAGDKVLRTVSHLLHKSIRETDFLARYGGEEFVVLMPETPLDTALQVADKLRQNVQDCGFHQEKDPVTITISCGVAEFHNNDTPESVFTRADAALYRAKDAGRNRCATE